jgi:hypothetical protein
MAGAVADRSTALPRTTGQQESAVSVYATSVTNLYEKTEALIATRRGARRH